MRQKKTHLEESINKDTMKRQQMKEPRVSLKGYGITNVERLLCD